MSDDIQIKKLKRYCYYCGKVIIYELNDRLRSFCSSECADKHNRESSSWRQLRRLLTFQKNN